jgi:hypothetical protein
LFLFFKKEILPCFADVSVSISAPVVTPDVQMMFSSENSLRVNGDSQTDIDQLRATRNASAQTPNNLYGAEKGCNDATLFVIATKQPSPWG